ncbi:tRNA pseudouridine32 synthase / 23S rRNA pseudouridine746 synthase [Prevotella sp. ne3005]|uniref:RluA family pseudouridine synthase n=1 Tax=Prevotella sp. ne3005 TaxID=1761887 RepID=UPI0008CA779E|nr:RluA family pseudouridine synthase [Prevotella sp. ne3005]SEM77078.1 tRNA pseudouridine32 synthase / 23S rRNA pseudouridine746 synthase [Prevotella sp. ne3005]
MSLIHLLIADLPLPERFTYPFCYEPHPLCQMAAEEVKREIERILPTEGKMFGVLVVKAEQGLGFLAAYSGLLEGRNDWPYFVPPVFDAQQPEGHFKQTERAISAKGGDKQMSQELQLWLFHQYRMLNAKGETKDLVDIWQDYHCSPRIRNKYPLPPGGTGDCCAPKLLQYAFSHGLRPVCMAEFWWGPSPKSEIRHHGQFYPACRGKCKPILTWMLQGLDVDPNPEETGASHLTIEVIYQDTTLAVINKPSGLLSVPGRTEDHSVATIAMERWPGSLPVHRLDMGTSGLMVIAKTKEAYVSLQEQFVKRTVKKRYIALVEGIVKEPKGRITLPLIFDPMNRPRQMVDYQRGKSAVTEYEVLDARDGRTLLALYPHTGRTHQLRMHCAHPDGLGSPIVGDELYGHKAERLCLHCDQIEFAHPVTGERMSFNLPNPF